MAFFDELGKKAQAVAAVAVDKAQNVAAVAVDKAKDAAELTKITVSVASEQRDIDKNYRTIGEWFVSEYEGEIPDAVRDLVESVNTSKAKIAELEASKPAREEPPMEPVVTQKVCPICGAASDSKFCPQCGAPMGE
ncbi:MAG: zinc ribbon domain-containing protein [Oscillibacter sp.]